jgi:hypothetical protein
MSLHIRDDKDANGEIKRFYYHYAFHDVENRQPPNRLPSAENRSHGSSLGNELRPFCNGTRFRYAFR